MDLNYTKIHTVGANVPLKVVKGHFATNHSHTNYYIDLTTLKSRVSEAQEIAKGLVTLYLYHTPIDTIVCMEAMEVIGTVLAEELTKSGLLSRNAHRTIYVTKPEYNSNSQVTFRDNIKPMISGKDVLILTGNVTTGYTVNKTIEGIQYYGGNVQAVASIFSAVDHLDDVRVHSVFGLKDLPDYQFSDYHVCPICKEGKKLDGLISPYGYSKL